MPEIVVTVKNKMAVGDGSVIVCNNSDYVVRFALDSEWDALALRTMRIVYDSYSHTDIAFSGDTVALPTIIDRTSIGIGLYSGDIHTSTCAMFDCERSVMGKNSNAVAPPSSDVYNEIVKMINDGRLKGDKGADGTNGADGANGADGVTFTPSVDSAGNLSWTNDGGLSNPATVNIKGATGAAGERGEQGIPGEPGAKGDKGDKGDKGEPGADAPQDVVRYAVQSLTNEQQMQVRANIGAAESFKVGDGLKMDGDVLSVKHGEYELIETITITEDITAIERDVNLNAVLVLATFEQASRITNAFLRVRFGSVERITGSSFIRNEGVSSARYSVEKKGAFWDLSSNGYVRGWGSGQYYGQGNAADVVFVKDNPTITKIRLYAIDGAAVIPNGSIIKIWGLRADA